jgi:hypothetical protein
MPPRDYRPPFGSLIFFWVPRRQYLGSNPSRILVTSPIRPLEAAASRCSDLTVDLAAQFPEVPATRSGVSVRREVPAAARSDVPACQVVLTA